MVKKVKGNLRVYSQANYLYKVFDKEAKILYPGKKCDSTRGSKLILQDWETK